MGADANRTGTPRAQRAHVHSTRRPSAAQPAAARRSFTRPTAWTINVIGQARNATAATLGCAGDSNIGRGASNGALSIGHSHFEFANVQNDCSSAATPSPTPAVAPTENMQAYTLVGRGFCTLQEAPFHPNTAPFGGNVIVLGTQGEKEAKAAGRNTPADGGATAQALCDTKKDCEFVVFYPNENNQYSTRTWFLMTNATQVDTSTLTTDPGLVNVQDQPECWRRNFVLEPTSANVLALDGGSNLYPAEVCISDPMTTEVVHDGIGIIIAAQCCDSLNTGDSGCRRKLSGSSDTDSNCVGGKPARRYNYDQAKQLCAEMDLVMCNRKCSQQGCGYDLQYVWTDLACESPTPAPTPSPTPATTGQTCMTQACVDMQHESECPTQHGCVWNAAADECQGQHSWVRTRIEPAHRGRSVLTFTPRADQVLHNPRLRGDRSRDRLLGPSM